MSRDSGQHAGLSLERVLEAAREIASREGLDKLTVRSLAAHLGVAPNAVYGWVESKAALLDALVDDALTDIADPRSAGVERSDPRVALEALLLEVFDSIIKRPELAPLFVDRAASPGPSATRVRLLVKSLLVDIGVAEPEADAAVPILLVHVLGFAAFVCQTHGAALLDEPHLGPPRGLITRSLAWLLAGITAPEMNQLGQKT